VIEHLPVSTLCDVDKALPVVDPAIRPLRGGRIAGPAFTVVANGEFLSVLHAISRAAPGDVLVIEALGAPPLAALGELLANEAHRRGLGGIVVDGYVRDRAGLPDLPLWARGSVPVAGRSDVVPRVGEVVHVGGVTVTPGDLVLADEDGIVIAPRERLEALRERAEAIERSEAAVLAAVRGGADLIALTNLTEHVAALRAGEPSRLAITPPQA
jgi:4-hydroxy-4-methyl-2-oxoglutarate aldolase